MKPWRIVSAGLLIAFAVGSLAHLGRAAGSPPTDPARDRAQLRFLAGELDTGTAAGMQEYFPEGEFFSWVLTGLAAARLAERGIEPDRNLRIVADAVAATGAPTVADRFGSGHRGVPHGAFYHGWRLLLLTAQAGLTRQTDQLDAVAQQAGSLLAALDAPGQPPLTSYPGRVWPCDLVVAMAAVRQASRLIGLPGLDAATERFVARLATWRDPATGLLGHTLGPDGDPSGARGSSQAIVNTYLRDISPEAADAEWHGFNQHFVVGTLGLVGVREYPVGQEGGGDVDSGPLIAGVSLSASAVALGAARRNGDAELAIGLHREAELLGLPLPWRGDGDGDGCGRAFLFGRLPIGDAFVVAARTQPLAQPGATAKPSHPGIWWPLWFALGSLPGLLGLLLLHSHRRDRPAGSR